MFDGSDDLGGRQVDASSSEIARLFVDFTVCVLGGVRDSVGELLVECTCNVFVAGDVLIGEGNGAVFLMLWTFV